MNIINDCGEKMVAKSYTLDFDLNIDLWKIVIWF
jgi:hypothetical protein